MTVSLNELIQSTRPTISVVVEQMRSGKYYVDNSFQRRLVWTERQKVRLIETILIGYPIPELYLWQQEAHPETGAVSHSIVDGQQRLSTLLQFTQNEFSLKKSFLDENSDALEYADLQWKDLPNAAKKGLWQYVLTVRTIPSATSIEEIRKIFSRLNETDKSLNPQELRNAKFEGKFVENSVAVANMIDDLQWNIFKPNDLRRMKDIEFASQLLIYHRQGIATDSPQAINRIYDLYNDEYKEAAKDRKAIRALLGRVADLFTASETVADFFGSPLHLYSLYVTLDLNPTSTTEVLKKKLENFVNAYRANPASDEQLGHYKTGSSSRTTSKTSRELRVVALRHWLAK